MKKTKKTSSGRNMSMRSKAKIFYKYLVKSIITIYSKGVFSPKAATAVEASRICTVLLLSVVKSNKGGVVSSAA